MFLGAVYMREEDPYRKRNKFKLGLHAEILVRVVLIYRRFEKELKIGGRQKQTRSLGTSALFTGVNNYLSTELWQQYALGDVKRNGLFCA